MNEEVELNRSLQELRDVSDGYNQKIRNAIKRLAYTCNIILCLFWIMTALIVIEVTDFVVLGLVVGVFSGAAGFAIFSFVEDYIDGFNIKRMQAEKDAIDLQITHL